MTLSYLRPGDRVTWLHVARGGYRYITPVDATVVRVGKKRVLVEVQHLRLGLVQRWVSPESLRERQVR